MATLDSLQNDYRAIHEQTEARVAAGEISRDQAQPIMQDTFRTYLVEKFKLTRDLDDLRMFTDEFRLAYLASEKQYTDGAATIAQFRSQRQAAWQRFEDTLSATGVGTKLTLTRIAVYFGQLLQEEDTYRQGKQSYGQMCQKTEVIFQNYLKDFLGF